MAQQDLAAAATDRDFEVYAWLREYEAHFNQTQVEIKKLASAWMLAGLAAIAFIVRGDLKSGSSIFDTAVLLGIIGAGANIGLFSLWILDQLCSQKLLAAAFDVGLYMERHNPSLPPIRPLMWAKSDHKGMGHLHAFFYACPMLFNALAAGYGGYHSSEWGLLAAGLTAVAPLAVVLGQGPFARLSQPKAETELALSKAEVTDKIDSWRALHGPPVPPDQAGHEGRPGARSDTGQP